MKVNDLTREIIGAAIEVHRVLGPGKAETVYEAAFVHELALREMPHCVQKPVPVIYKGIKLECGYRLDVLVADTVVVEIKAAEWINPIHRAQVLTYLKLGNWRVALLLNFNVVVLRDGIERLVLNFPDGEGTAEARQTQRGEIPKRSEEPVLRLATDSGDSRLEGLAGEILAGAAEVHHALGAGLLPSAYEACLRHELHLRGIPFERKKLLNLTYKGRPLPKGDEIELLVDGTIVVKPAALAKIEPVHEATLLSQLRLGGWPMGFVINFNTIRLGEGIRRIVSRPR